MVDVKQILQEFRILKHIKMNETNTITFYSLYFKTFLFGKNVFHFVDISGQNISIKIMLFSWRKLERKIKE